MDALIPSVLTWVCALSGLVGGIVQAKVWAMLFGPYGFGILGQYLAFMNLVTQPFANGIFKAAIRYISNSRTNEKELRQVIITSRITSVGIAAVFTLIILACKRFITRHIFGDPNLPVALIAAIHILFYVVSTTEIMLLQAFEHMLFLTLVNLLSSFGGLLILFLIIPFGFYGAFFQIIGATIWGGVIARIFYHRFRGAAAEPLFSKDFNQRIARNLLSFGAINLISGLSLSLTMLIVRLALIQFLGLEQNGIYQALLSVSNQVLGIVLYSTSVYWFPHLSRFQDPSAITLETNKFLRTTLWVATPSLALLITFRDSVVRLLYSHEFLAVAVLIPFQALGDYFRIIPWIIGASILPMGRLRAHAGLTFVWDILFLILFMTLLPISGLTGGVLSYLISNVIWMLIVYLYQHRAICFHFSTSNLHLVLNSLFVLSLVSILTFRVPFCVSVAMTVAALVVWALISTTRYEKQLIKHPGSLVKMVRGYFEAHSHNPPDACADEQP